MSDLNLYVADLAAYNAGFLHGVWVDATDDPADMEAAVHAMLATSPVPGAEEYAIHDYEGFGGYPLSEFTGLAEAHEIACFIDDYPSFGSELLAHVGDLEEARKTAEEDYCGRYGSLADYAEELTEQTIEVPVALAYYIDYAAMGRDMQINGDIFTVETGYEAMHIFWNR